MRHFSLLFVSSLLVSSTIAGGNGVREQANIPYRTTGEQTLKMDAYWPEGDGPFPAILCIHGGGWRAGDKLVMKNFCLKLAHEGFACFSIDYRLAPKSQFPKQIEDCVRAIQYLRLKASDLRIDPKRIGATGTSAGGHLSALLAVMDDQAKADAKDPVEQQSSRVACVAPFFGPMVLSKNAELPENARQLVENFIGKDASDEKYRDASPLSLVTPDDPPFLLIHGSADSLVPPLHSKLMNEKLKGVKVSSELILIEGGGHGDFFAKDPKGEYWAKMFAFFKKHLAK